jgi:hypothetical protein
MALLKVHLSCVSKEESKTCQSFYHRVNDRSCFFFIVDNIMTSSLGRSFPPKPNNRERKREVGLKTKTKNEFKKARLIAFVSCHLSSSSTNSNPARRFTMKSRLTVIFSKKTRSRYSHSSSSVTPTKPRSSYSRVRSRASM